MTTKRIKYWIYIIFFISSYSVGCQKKEINYKVINDMGKNGLTNFESQIISYNQKANYFLEEARKNISYSISTNFLDSSLAYVEKVLALDSAYHSAYLTKAYIEIEKKEYHRAVEILKNLVSKNERYPEAFFTLGLVNEKIGDFDRSMKLYKKSLELYNELIETNMSTSYQKQTKYTVLLFYLGKEEFIKQIDTDINNNPNDQSLIIHRSIAQNFDRQKYFENF